MRYHYYFIAVVVLFAGLAFLSKPISPQANDNPYWGTYTSIQKGFTLKVPQNWLVNDSGVYGTDVIFLGPSSNYNIIIIKNAPMNISWFVESSIGPEKSALANYYSNYSLASEAYRQAGKYNAYEIVYSYTGMKSKRVYVATGKDIFIMTFSGSLSSYNEYIPVFENSVSSLSRF